MLIIRGGLLALLAVALCASVSRGQATRTPNPPRSPDGQPVPTYPLALARAGVEGEVLFRLAVDSIGRPIAEQLRVTRSSHDLFTRAARAAVLEWRFDPGAGPADVSIYFRFLSDRTRCNPLLPAADSALLPQWYRYDRAAAAAHVTICPTVTYQKAITP